MRVRNAMTKTRIIQMVVLTSARMPHVVMVSYNRATMKSATHSGLIHQHVTVIAHSRCAVTA